MGYLPEELGLEGELGFDSKGVAVMNSRMSRSQERNLGARSYSMTELADVDVQIVNNNVSKANKLELFNPRNGIFVTANDSFYAGEAISATGVTAYSPFDNRYIVDAQHRIALYMLANSCTYQVALDSCYLPPVVLFNKNGDLCYVDESGGLPLTWEVLNTIIQGMAQPKIKISVISSIDGLTYERLVKSFNTSNAIIREMRFFSSNTTQIANMKIGKFSYEMLSTGGSQEVSLGRFQSGATNDPQRAEMLGMYVPIDADARLTTNIQPSTSVTVNISFEKINEVCKALVR